MREVAWLFAKLGCTAFGGPAAHVAMMEDEVVRRRGWMSREEFLDRYGAANVIPGPSSTELAIHLGHARAGWPGLVVAGACFIVPAAIVVTAIAWAYVEYGALPAFDGVLYGVKPAIIAIVAQALWNLGRTALRSWTLAAIAIAALAASLAGANALVILAGAGVLAASARAIASRASCWLPLPLLGATATTATTATTAAVAAPFGLAPLFLVFLKVGAVLFGSGYVLLAFLRGDLVDRLHWIDERQLLDAVAVGQITPGPVLTTATFVGYLLGGVPAAAIATLAIFLPAFVFVALSGPLVPRIRASPTASAVLDGVNVASLALMAAVTIALGRTAIVDAPTAIIALAGAIALVRFRVSTLWIVAAGAIVGLAAS